VNKKGKTIMHSLTLKEISGVGNPAQEGARVLLMKHADSDPLSDALDFAKGDGEPSHTRAEYEDAMLDIAKSEAREGEATAIAFARLVDEGDERISALYLAARAVEDAERARVHAEHFAAVDSGEFGAELAKRADAKLGIMARMEKIAADSRQDGESDAAAFARAMDSDATMQHLYQQYREL